MTCGRNIELIRFNKPEFHTRLEGLSTKAHRSDCRPLPRLPGDAAPSKSKALSSLRSQERPTGLSQQRRELVESGINVGETNTVFGSQRSRKSSSYCGHRGGWVISHLSAGEGRQGHCPKASPAQVRGALCCLPPAVHQDNVSTGPLGEPQEVMG